jgi:hypothetical protein
MKPSLLRRAHTVKTKTVWFGELEELGGDQYIVVSDTEENAKAALLSKWCEYDRERGSDYHGRVKTFDDLAEIYGAYVVEVPLNRAVNPKR